MTERNMDSVVKTKNQVENSKTKHKSPSKIERNKKRLEKFLNRGKDGPGEDKITQVNEQDFNKINQIDPIEIYKNLEINLNFTRIEEPKNLTRCLRHAVRHLHRNGDSIRFPCPEAEDRIHIKIAGLPTTPKQLWELICNTYKRREEEIALQSLYEDFVRTYGRNAFDPGKTGTSAFYISHIP